jgi:hypothetical protein
VSEPFIVSIHIPKTAGTTVAEVFSRCFNRRVLFDYETYDKSQTVNREVGNNVDFIRSYFDVIHGHFYAWKYLDVFRDAKFIASIRHPVERVISQYLHELNEDSSSASYHDDLVSGRMDVVDFAGLEGIGDAMYRHLAGRALNDYDLFIVSESLELSLRLFSLTVRPIDLDRHFGSPWKLPRENVGVARRRTMEFGQDVRLQIFNKTKLDNAVYAEAESIVFGLASRLG